MKIAEKLPYEAPCWEEVTINVRGVLCWSMMEDIDDGGEQDWTIYKPGDIMDLL